MGDMGDYWRDVKEFNKERKERNLSKAFDDGNWAKHNEYHWSRTLQGAKLQYWPSTNRFQHNGKTYNGGVEGYIRNRS